MRMMFSLLVLVLFFLPIVPSENQILEELQTLWISSNTNPSGMEQDVGSETDLPDLLSPVITAEQIENHLGEVMHILESEAVDLNADPQMILGTAANYTAADYFTLDVLDQMMIAGDTPVSKGLSGGGLIEVFASSDDASARVDWLNQYAGAYPTGRVQQMDNLVVRLSEDVPEENAAEVLAGIQGLADQAKAESSALHADSELEELPNQAA